MLVKLSLPGRPTNFDIRARGLFAFAVGAGGGCLDIFFFSSVFFSLFFLPFWETAQYRLKYCLKGPLNPKQPTNQVKIYVSIYF